MTTDGTTTPDRARQRTLTPRISATLHGELKAEARRRGISVNVLCTEYFRAGLDASRAAAADASLA